MMQHYRLKHTFDFEGMSEQDLTLQENIQAIEWAYNIVDNSVQTSSKGKFKQHRAKKMLDRLMYDTIKYANEINIDHHD